MRLLGVNRRRSSFRFGFCLFTFRLCFLRLLAVGSFCFSVALAFLTLRSSETTRSKTTTLALKNAIHTTRSSRIIQRPIVDVFVRFDKVLEDWSIAELRMINQCHF